MDYDESIRIMIEFISHHPITVPLTKIPNPKLPLCIPHKEFKHIKIESNALEVKIVPVQQNISLKAIDIAEKPKCLWVQEPTNEEFQSFLNQIRYNGEFKAKEFKKFVVPDLWTILMHLILEGLSGKHGGTGKGRLGIFDDWSDFVNKAHTRHLDLTREQVEYTFISMRQRALRSRLPFTFPSDDETDHTFNPFKEAQKITSTGDVPNSTNVSDDPPPKFKNEEAPKPPTNYDLSDEVMFEDDNTIVGAILIPTAFNIL
ncbi:unnamed protein product [Lactuca saligna]|uniref:Uncharacterized protein n=1 Tax=Lactuca saligna TaxID=75948 RepID=A0AA35YBN8_LACSI|nr:unnamed protein product [Lactuca saligna]